MRTKVFYFLNLATICSTSVYKNLKRDTDELDDDFFDEIENVQEVLEVPLEYEDDNKPSKIYDKIQQVTKDSDTTLK